MERMGERGVVVARGTVLGQESTRTAKGEGRERGTKKKGENDPGE